jgi:hypothetical protein
MFADIAGFTAWSSVRDPAQVCQFLQARCFVLCYPSTIPFLTLSPLSWSPLRSLCCSKPFTAPLMSLPSVVGCSRLVGHHNCVLALVRSEMLTSTDYSQPLICAMLKQKRLVTGKCFLCKHLDATLFHIPSLLYGSLHQTRSAM